MVIFQSGNICQIMRTFLEKEACFISNYPLHRIGNGRVSRMLQHLMKSSWDESQIPFANA